MALAEHVPKVERSPWGIVALIVNILFSGIGTIIAGAVSGKDVGKHVVIGIAQLLLTAVFVGWIWSIIWGVVIFTEST